MNHSQIPLVGTTTSYVQQPETPAPVLGSLPAMIPNPFPAAAASSSSAAGAPLPRRKRPGPKRDSKPAQSEKLERNRQAQRTHRERKEAYTKQLEYECMRLKDLFSETANDRDEAIAARDQLLQERDQLREENRKLRELLQNSAPSSSDDSGYEGNPAKRGAQAIIVELPTSCPVETLPDGRPTTVDESPGPAEPALSTFEDCEMRGFAVDDAILEDPSVTVVKSEETAGEDSSALAAILAQKVPFSESDYNELALDFVLTLERPCMHHIQYLLERAHNPGGLVAIDGASAGKPLEVPDDGENHHISGHALMATAPSLRHIMNSADERYPTQLPEVSRPNLLHLLNLSKQLEVTEVEIPPVKAWIKIMQNDRFHELAPEDFNQLKTELVKRVNCYRFGAVVEEHDIVDVVNGILNREKPT